MKKLQGELKTLESIIQSRGRKLVKKKLLVYLGTISILPLLFGGCRFYPFPYWDYDEEHGYHRHRHWEHHGREGGFHRGLGEDQKIEKVKESPVKEEK